MPIVPTTTSNMTIETSPIEVEEAKAWVFNQSTKFENEVIEFEKNLNASIDPVDYARNPLNSEKDNPESYTNLIKDHLDTTLQKEDYQPPNKAAEDLWSAYSNQFKVDTLTQSIVAESAINMNGRKQILTNTINDNAKLIEEKPEMYELKKTQTQFAFEGAKQYMSTNTKFELMDKAEKDYHRAYMKGSEKTSPMKLMEEILSGKHNKMDKAEVKEHYFRAFSNYKKQAQKDITELNTFIENQMALVRMGEADNLESLTMEDYYADELVMKLGALTPWFSKNMTDRSRRTKMNESQRTESVEYEGTAYLYPTIRWDDYGNEIVGITDYFFYALKQGDALAIKDEAQGTRISKKMSRMLSYGD